MLVGVLVRVGAQQSAVIAAVHQPAIVAKHGRSGTCSLRISASASYSTRPPASCLQPKGSQTSIKVVQQQSQGQQQGTAAGLTAAPPPEQTIRQAWWIVSMTKSRRCRNSQSASPTTAKPSRP
jgi:hypothetical protein